MFYTSLKVEVLSNGRQRMLTEKLTYFSELTQAVIHVPAGFVTDYASIPRIFWGILPPSGKYTKATVLHDYLYASELFDKKTADLIFKEAMLSLDVSKWKIYTMYYAVDWFGFVAWNKYRKLENNMV